MSACLQYAIGNWPPTQPYKRLTPPANLCHELEQAESRVAALRAELSEWRRRMERQHTRAWIAYHDLHGWPADRDYKERMLRARDEAALGEEQAR